MYLKFNLLNISKGQLLNATRDFIKLSSRTLNKTMYFLFLKYWIPGRKIILIEGKMKYY